MAEDSTTREEPAPEKLAGTIDHSMESAKYSINFNINNPDPHSTHSPSLLPLDTPFCFNPAR
eukprot:2783756-Amphidinium_carterae.1